MPKINNDLNLNECLIFAKNVANEADKIALKYFGFEIKAEWKENNSPLTIADNEINQLVIDKVKEKYPEYSVYGEEKSNLIKKSNYIWVCDPIDGTMPYSCGLPMFTFSLALVEQETGLPILGVISDPVMKNMYWAVKNKGAYRNGKKINVMQCGNLAQTCLNVDGSGDKFNFSSSNTINYLKSKKAKIMRLVSVIYGGIQVANGKFSGTIFFNAYGHDVAALKIITEEAGGKVTDLNGNDRRYDQDGVGCVISNGFLHKEILSCIKSK